MSLPYSPIRAPRGNTRTAKGWIQEAAKRMLMNNLDPEVAEKPEELIVYGGRGKAARNWDCYHKIIETLNRLENDQTLLVQSGKAVAVLNTHQLAPRVLIANSNLVPRWATWEEFDKLDAAGLMMYGQMTAGSWIYIGTQGILQGTYETFRGAAKNHFKDTLAGTITVTAGLGGMGGAQPLAIKLAGGVSICIEVDPKRIERRLQTRYLDKATTSLEEAIQEAQAAKQGRKAVSIGLMGNAADLLPEMVRLGFTPDLVTDQTSAHDPLWGYIPSARPDEDLNTLRSLQPQAYTSRVQASMARHVQAILEMQRRGALAFDYGNNLRAQAQLAGVTDAFTYPGFVPAFIRDSFCEGRGPFRWVALSGDPSDIAATDQALLDLFPDDRRLNEWLNFASTQVAFKGCLRESVGLATANGTAPDCCLTRWSVMDVSRRLSLLVAITSTQVRWLALSATEGMLDGSDAVSDWALLNFATGIASGAAWMSFHHGGGVGMGYSQHAGLVAVADGSDEADERLRMCLTNDPAMGVIRHADAGYELAKTTAKERGLDMPSIS